MIVTKKRVLRFLLFLEIVIVGIFFTVGDKGFIALHNQQQEQVALQASVSAAQKELADLHHQITLWQTNDFYKEQFAREQLHMARPEEEIYILD